MSRVLAIASREWRGYFLSPAGYIIIGLFLLITGGFFHFRGLNQGQVASLRSVFGIGTWMLAFIAPAVTMRLLSEEYRLGTIETLLTAPVRERHIILGKFLGSMGFLAMLVAPTILYVVALEMHGRPDYGEIAAGYLGWMLAASAYVACGLLASSLTSSQPVAFLLAVFFWVGLGLATKLAPERLGEAAAAIAFALDPDLRLRDFTIGLIDSANIVYFVVLTVVFLVAATVSLASRRWP